MLDEQTYGFNKADATELVQLIGGEDREHNDWHPVPNDGAGGGVIEYTITSLSTAASGPYTGLIIAAVVVKGAPCNRSSLIGTTVNVVDHSGCIFDEASMAGYTGWGAEMVFWSLDAEADCETLTPCHWAAINRCCGSGSGTYADECLEYNPEGYDPEGYVPEGYFA